MTKRNLTSIFLLTILLYAFMGKHSRYEQKEYSYNVTIHRDIWGVPHIYGDLDEDAAFGLAYAHSEDDFKTIQDVLLALRGKLASVKGKDAAPVDYLVGMLKVWDTVELYYESQLSEKMKRVCQGYADGINRYIEKNPTNVISGLYPVSGKDIVAGFVFRTPLMFEFDWYIKKLMSEEKPTFAHVKKRSSGYSMYGSNVIAVGPSRSSDQHTRIAINSHQPWEGPVTWYEAHIHSNEGWNVSGGLFPGSPVVFKGYNEHLAWSHTVNDPDLVDIYELTINPDNKNQYLLDGEWIDFEKRDLPITVKLWGPFHWTFKRELSWSLHGPVITANHGVYAMRYSGHSLVGQVEQWYKMNKSQDLYQFKDAMSMMQLVL